MDAPLDLQIQHELLRYLRQAISLNEFCEWFVPRSWDIEESGNRGAIALAHHIDGLLGEASSAEWSESDLRQALANSLLPFVGQPELLNDLATVSGRLPDHELRRL